MGLPLSGAYAVTDYYCQGASFKEDCWFVHLAPPSNKLSRASVLVALTRFKDWASVKSIAPIYDPRDPKDRERVIKRFMSASVMDPMLASELGRLQTLAKVTQEKYAASVANALQA